MGAKQSKMEGSYLPSTPITQYNTRLVNFNADNNLDPRSPSGCRTPINLENNGIGRNVQLATDDMPERDPNNENALELLRKRIFKTFTYNINDPRSPSVHLHRTPLVFDDTLEKSLSLDDTFADLFVESHMHKSLCEKVLDKVVEEKPPQSCDVEMIEEKVITHLEEASNAPQTPKSLQQQIDPRSPSMGVERTPIIFTDDEVDDANEDIMLEGILATLSLNLNNSECSSVVSMASQNVKNDSDELPVNKHLERVRACKKSSPKIKHIKSKRRPSQQKIYEDLENHMPTTPKLKFFQSDKNDTKGKRTPLGCVRNRNGTHARSRSVESSIKSIKSRLVLTSFDDTLNDTENDKVPNLLITQKGSED